MNLTSVTPPVCLQEREENVKADVFHAYLSLLKQTRPAQSWLADPDAMEQGETPLTMLQSQVTPHETINLLSHTPSQLSQQIHSVLVLKY